MTSEKRTINKWSKKIATIESKLSKSCDIWWTRQSLEAELKIAKEAIKDLKRFSK